MRKELNGCVHSRMFFVVLFLNPLPYQSVCIRVDSLPQSHVDAQLFSHRTILGDFL